MPLRDAATHELLPGVHTGDIGPKIGYNTMDNGTFYPGPGPNPNLDPNPNPKPSPLALTLTLTLTLSRPRRL